MLSGLSRAHAAAEHEAWLGYFASPAVAAVTITVTEAGYLRGGDGGLDRDRPEVAADVEALRQDPAALVRTAPARLAAGLAARRRADAGPVTLMPCDNLPHNGEVATRVVHDLAEMVDPGVAGWMADSVSCVTTMVDRITPRTTEEDVRAVAEAIAPFEERKLWLLNGGHSLLAYAGSARGHETVAEAVADDACREWLEEWWDEAARYLPFPEPDVAAYPAATRILGRHGGAPARVGIPARDTPGHHRLTIVAISGGRRR